MTLGIPFRFVPARRVGIVLALVAAMIAAGVAIAPRFNRAEAAGINLSVTISDATKVEGNSGTTNLEFDVTLSGVVLSATNVGYATFNGTATEPSDYTKKSGSLTFTQAGTQTISIPIVGDTETEANETFTINLSADSGVTIADGQGKGTITNDDFALTVADLTVNEGNSGSANAVMTINISSPKATVTTVKYATVDGTAKAPGDYTTTSGTATIAANASSTTVNLPIVGDTLYEDDETFTFKLSEPSTGALLGDDTAIVTIDDNEDPPTDPNKSVLSVETTSFKEGAQGATSSANFSVKLTPASTKTVTVKASTSDGSAKAPGDYAAKTGFTLTFAPGETSQTFPVIINGDNVFENDESFTVTLSEPSAAAKLATTPSAIGTILEDDERPTLSIADAQATEGSDVTFTFTLSAAAGQDTTVRWGTGDLTATEPVDYTKVPAGTLAIIPAGQTTKTVTVTTKQDTLDEADELFGIVGQIIDGQFVATPVPATGKIVDDDNPPQLDIADISNDEGNAGDTTFTFTVTLTAGSGQQVTVNYGTSGETAVPPGDFTAANGTLTFAPGETSKTFNVLVKGETVSEDNETFKISLTNPVGATIRDGIAQATIKNDDEVLIHADHITTGAGPGGGTHVKAFDIVNGGTSASFFSYSGSPGVRVARGDLDGDGKDEIIIAPGPGVDGVISVFTSKGEGVVAQAVPYQNFGGGVWIATGDLDGDGKDEVITAPGAGGGPHVRVYKLTGTPGNRSLTATPGFYGTDQNFSGGLSVASADVDGDGKAEIIVGNGPGGQSIVTVWDYNPETNVATPNTPSIPEFLAYPGFTGGVRVAAGDLDGDDKAEIVTGAGPGGNPHVRVFSGVGGGLPGSAYAYNEGFRGGVFVAVGDIDGDGENEVITGAGPGGGPHVRTFDLTMTPLPTSFFAYDTAFSGGVFVAAGRP